MTTNSLTPLIAPRSTAICHLIRELLLREFKLQNPDTQSWYWQKGIKGQRRRLNDLYNEFDRVRSQFNRVDSDTLTNELITIQRFEAETLPGIRPHLTKQLMTQKCIHDRSRIEEMLEMKKVVKRLPCRSRLRGDESLMGYVFGVK